MEVEEENMEEEDVGEEEGGLQLLGVDPPCRGEIL